MNANEFFQYLVTNNATGEGATRTSWAQIRLYLNQQFVANYLP